MFIEVQMRVLNTSKNGAQGRNRNGMVMPPRDFKTGRFFNNFKNLTFSIALDQST